MKEPTKESESPQKPRKSSFGDLSSPDDGPLRRKSQLAKFASVVHPNRIHPVSDANTAQVDDGVESNETLKKTLLSWRPSWKSLLLRLFLMVAVCLCIGWTFWLVMLNLLPNDTVNQVMDDGAFWLLVEPPIALVTLAAFGLSIVAIFYFIVLIKLLTARQIVKQAYKVKQSPDKFDSIAKKVEKVLDNAATKPKRAKVVSNAVKLAASLADIDLQVEFMLITVYLHPSHASISGSHTSPTPAAICMRRILIGRMADMSATYPTRPTTNQIDKRRSSYQSE